MEVHSEIRVVGYIWTVAANQRILVAVFVSTIAIGKWKGIVWRVAHGTRFTFYVMLDSKIRETLA